MKKGIGFRCAVKGIIKSAASERNMRIHLAFVFYVTLFSAAAGLTRAEWAAVLLCFGLVVGSELTNTAIERMCDAVHPGFSELIGKAKDAAAGAVLVCAAVSVAVGSVIFFESEKLGRVAELIRSCPVAAVLVALTLPVCIFFVLRGKK